MKEWVIQVKTKLVEVIFCLMSSLETGVQQPEYQSTQSEHCVFPHYPSIPSEMGEFIHVFNYFVGYKVESREICGKKGNFDHNLWQENVQEGG